jgi:hypothetical protein
MNWVRYSHFAGAMQGQKPFPDGNHNGFVKKAGCCVQASSLVIAAYTKVRLIPQDSRALPAAFLRSRPIFTTFKTFYGVVIHELLDIAGHPCYKLSILWGDP